MRRTLVRLAFELRDLRRAPERSIVPDVIERWLETEREQASSADSGRDGT